jgi:hypothetical protein
MEKPMTKLLDRVDSAATQGARDQAAKSHASMLKVGKTLVRSGQGKVRVYGLEGKKIVRIECKPK